MRTTDKTPAAGILFSKRDPNGEAVTLFFMEPYRHRFPEIIIAMNKGIAVIVDQTHERGDQNPKATQEKMERKGEVSEPT